MYGERWKTSSLYELGGGRLNNPCGICKWLRLVGAQPFIVKSKGRIGFKVQY